MDKEAVLKRIKHQFDIFQARIDDYWRVSNIGLSGEEYLEAADEVREETLVMIKDALGEAYNEGLNDSKVIESITVMHTREYLNIPSDWWQNLTIVV